MQTRSKIRAEQPAAPESKGKAKKQNKKQQQKEEEVNKEAQKQEQLKEEEESQQKQKQKEEPASSKKKNQKKQEQQNQAEEDVSNKMPEEKGKKTPRQQKEEEKAQQLQQFQSQPANTDGKLQKSDLKIPRTFIGKKSNFGDNFSDDEKELIGEGGFAKVYKIKNKLTKEERAMKVLEKAKIPFQQQQQQQQKNAQQDTTTTSTNLLSCGNELEFVKEIKVLTKLVHPNIVRLFEFYEDAQYYYMITELVKGRELFDEISERDFFSEREAASIMHQVFSALAYCHQQGVVHRDIKPENILVQKEGDKVQQTDYNIKIIDWGLGAEIEANQYLTQKCGTPYYAAPEIFKKKYDEKCDVWSAGVIMYLLIGQEIPFYGDTSEEVIKKILKTLIISKQWPQTSKMIGKYTMESKYWMAVSEEAKDLVKKLLTYNPENRISAQEALQHAWFQINMGAPQLLNSQNMRINLERLKEFNAQSKLQAATVSFITSQLLSSEEQQEMLKIFRNLDTNCDGLLQREEILAGYKKLFSAGEDAEHEVKKIFDSIDFDKSGTIDYNEFVAATIDKRILVTKNKLKEAFKLFDKDGDGFITATEIAKVLDDQISNYGKDVWEEIVKEADENGDGQISFEEFSNLMSKLISSCDKQKQQKGAGQTNSKSKK